MRQIFKFPWLFCLLGYIMISQSCGRAKKQPAPNQFSPIDMRLEIQDFDQQKQVFTAHLFVKSNTDTVKIEKLEILHPSFVRPIGEMRKGAVALLAGEADTLSTQFEIHQKTSFKLKAAVYGAYYGGRMKISNVCYAFFFFDSEKYLIGYEIKDILGKKKRDGSKISKKDLGIYNQIEFEN